MKNMPMVILALALVLTAAAPIFAPLSDKTLFISAEQTGSGIEQDVAHGLGGTPSRVFVALTGGPAISYTQPVIATGTHTSTNVKVTCTLDWKYRIIALR